MQRGCDTGDLILFSGSSLRSVGVVLATGNWWSHVGMVIRSDQGDLFLFESSPTENQVALTSLRDVLRTYSGVYCIRPLKRPFTKCQKQKLCRYINETLGKPFEQDATKWISAAAYSWIAVLPLIGPLLVHSDRIPSDNKSFICSELIVGCFLCMGLDVDDRVPISIVPNDMTSFSNIPIFGTMFQSCLYEEECDVDYNSLM